MVSLQRITIQYILSEDRIRLTGEDVSGTTRVLWMSQRILNRLIPHICQSLEAKQDDILQSSLVQAFAQQKARMNFQQVASVKAHADSQSLLVQNVDVKTLSSGIELCFKDKDGQIFASLILRSQVLRSWLNIVYDQYLCAEWSTSMWPLWIAEAKPPSQPATTSVLH